MTDAAELFSLLIPALLEGVEVPNDSPAAQAEAFLRRLSGDPREDTGELAEPFASLLPAVEDEISRIAGGKSDGRGDSFRNLLSFLGAGGRLRERPELLWELFFPEALHLDRRPEDQIEKLRDKRRITVVKPNPEPIVSPETEMMLTSNVLLTLPFPDGWGALEDPDLKAALERVADEPQRYWYDHPIPFGTPAEANEALYGLKGLARAYAEEYGRNGATPLKVALSVSVTHPGLRSLAGTWLRQVLSDGGEEELAGLEVYGVTEEDCRRMLDLLRPQLNAEEADLLAEVFGVDGEYGRHYSFLKAFPALFAVLADPKLKATFKIDLDQIFPQEEIRKETGKGAFGLFTSPLWGAEARDNEGRELELGMIAGGLVNEKDIVNGLFTPDIPWPEGLSAGEELLFFKQRPMAVSTRAELMTRYGSDGMPDGRREALQRIHVTGGTNGILLGSLRSRRPFTPSFVGRAEDQAYILSALVSDSGPRLAYLHQPGLIMRHDKEAFAAQAVKFGKAGSYVGDLVRTFVFSDYASFLPGGQTAVKELVDPFTGCFITPMPATSVALRLALHLMDGGKGSGEARQGILDLAAARLPEILHRPRGAKGELAGQWRKERRAWDIFYDLLDRLESEPSASLRRDFMSLLKECRLI